MDMNRFGCVGMKRFSENMLRKSLCGLAGAFRSLETGLLMVLLAGGLAVSAVAQTATLPPGEGSQVSPYEISTLDHLYWISSNAPSFATYTYFIQTADIDASDTKHWFGGQGWPPINCDNYLKLYDGQGHTIRGLWINAEEGDRMGFLGNARGAEFRNVGLLDIYVTMSRDGGEAMGGFAATCDNTILRNCYATGVVWGVAGQFSGQYAGGLVGEAINSTLIERCSFIGQVTYTLPSPSYFMDGVGGLAGLLSASTIRSSYARGVVGNGENCEFPLGGFVGISVHGGAPLISECYTATRVDVWNWLTLTKMGQFMGVRDGGTSVTNCYVDWEENGTPDIPLVGSFGSPFGITGTNTAAMKTQSTYVGWLFAGAGAVWGLSSGTNDGYPYLKEPSTAAVPTLTTATITNIGTTTASGGGAITDFGGEDASQHGLCWSTSPGPTTAGSKTTLGAASATGSFNSSLSGLSYGTMYYVRAYAENSAGVGYGNEVNFTTLSHADAVAAAKAALEIGYASGDTSNSVTQDVSLPLDGEYDTSVSWASSDPSVVLVDGGGGVSSVFRPLSSDGDATVQLTATLTSGSASDTRVFTVTVTAESITLSADMITEILPDKLYVEGNHRLTLIGRNFRAYVNKDVISFSVSKGAWTGTIAVEDLRVVSDQLMAITVPVDSADPLGLYTLSLDHDTLQDLTLTDAFEVTDDPSDRVQTIQEIVLSTSNPDVDVQTLSVKGAFDEELPGYYTIAGEGQTVLFNNYLMLEVEGDDLTVDLRAGRKRITGTGRFTVNAEDASGKESSVTLYDGAFELEEFDMEFVFSDDPTLTDYLGISMEVGPKSMVFTQDGEDIGLSMQGIMDAGFNFLGRVGAEVGVDEVQVSLDGFDLVANLGVEANFEIAGFDSPRLALGIDTITPEYAFGCGATIKKISEKYGFDLDFTIRKGKLQSIAILIRVEIEMPQIGTKITAFGGGVDNLADQTKAPMTVKARAQVSDMVAPEVLGNNFLNADLSLGVSAYHMEATGEADIYGLLDIGEAKMVVIWDASGHPRYSTRGFQLEGHVDVLGAIIGDLLANYWESQGFFGEYEAKVQIPSYVPLVGGTTLKEERFYSDQYKATAPFKIVGIPTVVTYQYNDSSVDFDVQGFPLVQKIGKALVNFGHTIYDIGRQVGEVMSRSLDSAKDALMRGDLGEAATELAKGVVESARVAAEQAAVAVAQLAEAAAAAIAEAAAAAAEAIVDVAEEVGDFFSDLFCEEGRNALSKHVGSQMTALIEVRGMVSSDLVIQAPDYYTTYLTNKPAATRFFRADSGYPIAHPASTSTVTLVDYNPATGEGNMLYRPDTKKAYVVVNLDQVGYWNFIDWNWINVYTNAAERSNVVNYASVKIYKLTPGCTLDYVVKNLLVTNAPGAVLDLTDAVAQSGASHFLLSIASDSEKVSLYRPAGGAYRLQLDRNQPDWNALYVPEAGTFYAVIEPGDELAGWRIEADGQTSARAFSITNDTRSMMESLANSGLRTDFRLTAEHVASGKAMIALGHATEACALTRPDGTALPLVFAGPGRNADYQASYDMVYVLAEVTGSDAGLWNAVDGAVVTPHVLALDGASTLDSMLAMLAASPDVMLNKVTLEDVGPWLLRAPGVSSTNGITVRDPTGQIVSPPMLVTNDAGSWVLYVRVDTTEDTVGEWVFSSSHTLPLQPNWIAEPLLTLPELATRYRAGRPYSFALGLTTIGRRVFEVGLVVPAARQADFDFAGIRDDIVVYRPDGTTLPLEFNEASTNWNSYYHAATSNLYLMTDVLDVGWWHVNVPYGRSCTTWLVTGDPAQTMSDFKDVAAGLGSGRSLMSLPKMGYYLLEIKGGDASTRILKPDPVQAMLDHEVVQTADNARQVGDTLFVMVQSDGVPDSWTIESSGSFTFSASFCEQDVPGPLTLSDALDSTVTTELELAANTSWALNIESLADLAAAQSVTLQQPDGTNYVFEFLPPEGLSEVENYPNANARYETNSGALVLSVNATQGGTWLLTTPGRQSFDLYQLGYLPSVEAFEFVDAPGAEENTYDITWTVDHPAAGTMVSVFLASEADVLAGQLLGRELASGLNFVGTTRVQVPIGLLPGRYFFVLAARSASMGMLMEAAGEAITVRYADTPPAPTNLRLDSTANGEIQMRFDDVNYFGVNRYVVMTHLVRSNEAASSVGVMRFSGGTLAQAPGEGEGNGIGQQVTLAGLDSGQTNLIAICAVVGEDEASQFSPPSEILEVYLPAPNRPTVGLNVTVGSGYSATAGSFTNFFRYREVVTNEHGRPVLLPGTNEYQTVWRTNAVIERAVLINSTSATVVAAATDGQPCTYEVFLNDVSVGVVATPGTQAVFAISGFTEGEHALEVVAVNASGDRHGEALQLLVDRTAPYLELFRPLSGLAVYNTSVTLVGQTEPGATLLINSQDITSTIGQDGRFTNTLAGLATNALHTLTLQATDAAGNQATRLVQVFVVSVDPSLYPANNADLIGLEIENGTLNQTFRSKTTNGYSIAASSSHIRLAPTAFAPGATVWVSVNGGSFVEIDLLDPQEILLGPGSNTLVVRVIARDGTTEQEYSFTAEGGVSEYTVTASVSGLGGLAIPMEPQTVESNRTATFQVFPERGYLADVSVGGTAGAGGWTNDLWTTGPITQDSTVVFGFTGGGVIELQTNALAFASTYLDSASPPAQSLAMDNTGIGTFSWSNSIAYGAGASGWLSVQPASGATEVGGTTVFTNVVNGLGFNAGTYAATVTVTSATATNSPQRYVVRLVVDKAAQTVAFANPGKQVITNKPTLIATAAPSGLPVTFASVVGPVELSSSFSPAEATFTDRGWVTIVAGQGGNSNWHAAGSVTQRFDVTSILWVSPPQTEGVYSNHLCYPLFAWEIAHGDDLSYSCTNLPSDLAITNLDLIETVAGNGEIGFAGDGGVATLANLNFASSVAAAPDGGFYFTDDDNHRVRKVDTNGILHTVAGNGSSGYGGDGGAATNATLDWPTGVAVDDAGNLYIADFRAQVVRKVDTNGIIQTVAGTGESGHSGDGGAATQARLSGPSSLCLSAGRLYIADQINCRVRVVDTNGMIHAFAGNGEYGYSGDDGAATNAALLYPTAVAATRNGDILIADRYNNRIRSVATNGIIRTIAGTGYYGFGGDGGPATNALLNYPSGVAADDLGRIYIADSENSRLRMIETNGIIRTIAGTGNHGYGGDLGPALAAVLDSPAGLAVDSTRGILFADYYNNRIRRMRWSAALLQGIPQAAGDYAFTLWAGDGAFSNHQDFALHIDKAPATILFSNLVQVYDGTARVPDIATEPVAVAVDLTYNGWSNSPVNAGQYAVTGVVNDANWQGTNTTTLTIQKATASVALTNLTWTYDGSPKSPASLTSPTGLAVVLTFDGVTNQPVNAGWYMVTGAVVEANWQGSATGRLFIGKGTAGISFGATSQVYNGTGRQPTVTTAPTGLIVDLTFDGGTPAPVQVGSYSITGVVADANWQGTNTTTLTISKATAGVVLNDLFQIYDGAAKYATSQTSPTGLLVALTYDGVSNAPIPAGSYIVTGMVDEVNWQGGATGTLVIGKGTADISFGATGHVYDGTAKTPTTQTFPTGLTVALTYNGSPTEPVNAGAYAVTGTVVEANWQGTNTTLLTIDRAEQTIAFPPLADQELSNRVGLAATASPSGLPVAFAVASGHATLAGSTNLSFQRVGPVVVVASQAGNSNYLAAAQVPHTFRVYSPPFWLSVPVTNGGCSQAYSYRLDARDPDGWLIDYGGVFSNGMSLATNVDERRVHLEAGNGTAGYVGDSGKATNRAVYRPSNVSLAKAGGFFVADQYNHRVRAVSADGYIETVAGNGSPGFSGDGGAATHAQLRFPADSVEDDEGNLYIADRDNHRIRKVDADGFITTLAGAGLPGYGGDNGPATNAALNFPAGLALDEAGENLYIADRDNHCIRRIALSTGVITTVAGTGMPGNTGDGGPATAARLRNPTDIVLDGEGNLYIADQNNNKVRWVNALGTMATLAGTGTLGYSGDGGAATNAMLKKPYGVALDAVGRLYICDTDNHRIRQVTLSNGLIQTIAGTGVAGYNGEEILATHAQYNAPYGVAADARGNVLVADNNNQRIRRLDVGSVYLTGTLPTSGSYPVELTATDKDNYTTTQSFAIVVAKTSANVFLAGLSATYDGTAKSVTATTMPIGLTVVLTYNGSSVAPVNVGTYTVTGTVDEACYQGTTVTNLVINKASQAALTFNPSSPQMDRTTNALSVSGGSGTGAVSYAVASGPGMIVGGTNLTLLSGTGMVTVVATKAQDAFYLAASATATVAAAYAAEIYLLDLRQIYDGTAKTASATTMPAGLTVQFTYNGSATAPTATGVYAVVGTVNDGEYWATATGTLQILVPWDYQHVTFSNGWSWVGWFGFYAPMGDWTWVGERGYGWLWHEKHGFLYVPPGSLQDDAWLFSMDMGWLWTGKGIYPFLLREEDQAWLWYNGSVNPRRFYNFTSEVWEQRP